jgi:hypothetical protein
LTLLLALAFGFESGFQSKIKMDPSFRWDDGLIFLGRLNSGAPTEQIGSGIGQ